MRVMIIYGLIGLSCAALEYFLFIHFNESGFGLLSSNTFAILIAICCSFLANTFLNFKRYDNLDRRGVKFLLVSLSGLLLSNFLVYHLIPIFNIQFSKIISIPPVALLQFFINKIWTFRGYKLS